MTQTLPHTSYGNTHREPCHGRHNSGEPAQPRSILKNPLPPQSSDPNIPSHYTDASTQTGWESTNSGKIHHPCEHLAYDHGANSTHNPYHHLDSISTHHHKCACYTPGAQATQQQHRGPWRDPYCANHDNHNRHHQCRITPTHPFHFNPASNFTPTPTPAVHHHSHSSNRAINLTSPRDAVTQPMHLEGTVKSESNYPTHFSNQEIDRNPNVLRPGESALAKLGLTPPTTTTACTTASTTTSNTSKVPTNYHSYPDYNLNPAKDADAEVEEGEGRRGRSRTAESDHRAYPYLVRSPDYGGYEGRGWVMLPSPPSSLGRRGSWVRERPSSSSRYPKYRQAHLDEYKAVKHEQAGDGFGRYVARGGRGGGGRRTVYEDRYAEHDDEEVEGREAIEVLGGLVALVVSKVARVLGDENEEEEMEGVRRGRGVRRAGRL